MTIKNTSAEAQMVSKDRSSEAYIDNQESSHRLSSEAQDAYAIPQPNVAAEAPVYSPEISAILNGVSITNQNNPEAFNPVPFNPVPNNQEQIVPMPNNQEQINPLLIDLIPGSSEQSSLLPDNSEQSLQPPMMVSQDNSLANGEQAALGIMESVMGELSAVGESFASSDSDLASANTSADSVYSEQTAQDGNLQTTGAGDQWPPAWMLKYAASAS